LRAIIAIRQIQRHTGAVRCVIEHCKYLKAMGYDITIIAERYNREILDECGADFVRIIPTTSFSVMVTATAMTSW